MAWVSHPSLPDHPSHENAKKYFRKDCFGAVLSFGIKGGSAAASKFISALKLVSHVANVGCAVSALKLALLPSLAPLAALRASTSSSCPLSFPPLLHLYPSPPTLRAP